jgi:hypothetical protein
MILGQPLTVSSAASRHCPDSGVANRLSNLVRTNRECHNACYNRCNNARLALVPPRPEKRGLMRVKTGSLSRIRTYGHSINSRGVFLIFQRVLSHSHVSFCVAPSSWLDKSHNGMNTQRPLPSEGRGRHGFEPFPAGYGARIAGTRGGYSGNKRDVHRGGTGRRGVRV